MGEARILAMHVRDRRVKRTQNLLAQALLALIAEKGYEAITIRDITERADIGYATFFRHYRDKDELLRDVADVVINELLEILFGQQTGSEPTAVGQLIFRYVAEHSAVVRVLLGSRGPASLVQHVIQRGSENVLRQNKPRPGSPVPAEIAAHHLVASSIALIQWWIEHDMPYPPERMGEIYRQLIVQPTLLSAFITDPD
uniref:TetR family transcriptional regulator n=1 Tax=Thermogemmatispora argillosa TaxID=2045280 RepID=A0A455T7B3_9CHLR|nr:TetR family transcriptional regulator [Thermogemmatispora argillosa]